MHMYVYAHVTFYHVLVRTHTHPGPEALVRKLLTPPRFPPGAGAAAPRLEKGLVLAVENEVEPEHGGEAAQSEDNERNDQEELHTAHHTAAATHTLLGCLLRVDVLDSLVHLEELELQV